MQKARDYSTLKGWETKLEETTRDFKDLGILVRRTLGLSHYGFKNGGEMTSREREDVNWRASARLFSTEQEFQLYAMTHEWPIGRCVIGHGKNARRYDDTIVNHITIVYPTKNHQNILQPI
jgi:hypothetical protein